MSGAIGITPTITIGSQVWTSGNLRVDHYRNGDPIPQVTASATWTALTTGAWCYLDNDPANEYIYGKLYNWYAVNDSRGLAPLGYHVPTNSEWTTLSASISSAGGSGAMKETGTTHWNSPNVGATNSSRFTGFGGGFREYDGIFASTKFIGIWWSSTEANSTEARYLYIQNNSTSIAVSAYYKTRGLSIRCIKD